LFAGTLTRKQTVFCAITRTNHCCFINDFNVSYEITTKSIFKSIVVNALANNVFNVDYVSNGADYGGGNVYYYPQAGAKFLVGLTLKF
jgi:iron complex outermembrane receptor protein